MRVAFAKFRILIFIFVAALPTAPVWSQTGEELTLQALIQELINNNPEIQAMESRYQAALARPSQVRTLPDPTVSFVTRNADGNPVPFTTLGSDPLSSVGLMWEQELPYPGKLNLAGKIAEKEADVAKTQIEATRWQALSELKQAYFEYFQANRSARILRDSLDLLKQIESIAEARYGVGQAIQQDVLRAQVEISAIDQKITIAEREKATAAAQINQLLNRPVDNPLPPPAEVSLTAFTATLEQLQRDLVSASPAVLSNEAMVQRERLNVDLAKKQYRPDFMTSVEYGNSPNFPDMWEIQIGLRIPIFYKKKQAYGVVEASRSLTGAEKELRATTQKTSFDVKNEYLQIQASEKLIRLYDGAIIPQSKLALESGIASYQVGNADFLTTLSNFLTVLEYRMSYFEELARHESAIARLEQAVGHSLTSIVPMGDQKHE